MKQRSTIVTSFVVVLGLIGASGCGGGGSKSDGYVWTAIPTDESFGQITYLESLPAGSYTGGITLDTYSKSRYLALFKATVDSNGNMVGTVQYLDSETITPTVTGSISGKPVFDGSNFNNNWRHYEEHFHLPYPTMMIDLGDGNGPQPHKVIFDRPLQVDQATPRTHVQFYIDADKYAPTNDSEVGEMTADATQQ